MISVQGIPDTGCNVFNGTYFDNYNSNFRTRYYIYDGQAVASSTSTYNSLPSGSICYSQSDLQSVLLYDPLLQTGLIIAVIIGVIAVMLTAYAVIIKPFIKVKRG